MPEFVKTLDVWETVEALLQDLDGRTITA